MAVYTLRDKAGYVLVDTDDLEEALRLYDDNRGQKVYFDDFKVTDLRDRLTERRKAEKEADG